MSTSRIVLKKLFLCDTDNVFENRINTPINYSDYNQTTSITKKLLVVIIRLYNY